MTAELLRRAAKVLREHGEGATPGPWTEATDDPETWRRNAARRMAGALLQPDAIEAGRDEG